MMPESPSDQPAPAGVQPTFPSSSPNPLAVPSRSQVPMASPGYGSAPSAAPPQVAEDTDLIETEWVEAAKRIIEANRDDPYNQNRAMTLLRADYMKKRYNKDIKIPES